MNDRTMPFRAVEVILGAGAYTVAPGTSLAVPFTLINHTGQDDYFDIQVQGVPDDWVLLEMPVMHLAPDERRDDRITFQTPGTSPLSEGVYPVTLRATSQVNAQWWGEASFNLTVSGIEATRPAAGASTIPLAAANETALPFDSGGQIGLTMDQAQFSVAPGGSLAIPAAVTNRGMVEDNFFLSVDGLPPAWVSSSAPSLHLYPGEQRPLTLVIAPPLSPTSRAGRYPFQVRISSQANPGLATVVEAVLTVAAVRQFTADLNPRYLEAGRTARLRIQNLSNIQETYHLTVQSEGDKLEFVSNLAGPVNVLPGETAAVDFNVSRRGPNLLGGQSVIPYTVVVQSAEGESQSLSGEVTSRALLPLWVLAALLVFCLTAVCGLGFLWNWNQNRQVGATQTAAANVAFLSGQTATALILQQTPSLTPAQPTFTPITPLPSASQAATSTVTPTPALPTLTPITPTITFTVAPSNTPIPTLPPITNTSTATLAPPTTAPAATATSVPFPVAGQQLFLFAANPSGSQPQILLFDSANGSLKALTQGAAANTQPAWSPDGKKIAFTTNRDGNNEIYVMNADGTSPVNLTRNPGDDNYPAWSPDGAKIVFTSNRDGNNEIYVMNADGSNPVNLTKSPANDIKPVWYTEGGLLTSTSRILFASDRSGHSQIYTMNTDGSNVVDLSKNTANDSSPDVLFTGGKIVFTSDRDGNQEIYVMGLDGSNPANLTQNAAADVQPAWSPDGKWIAFVSNRSGSNQVYIMTADGKQVTMLSKSGQEMQYPAWH